MEIQTTRVTLEVKWDTTLRDDPHDWNWENRHPADVLTHHESITVVPDVMPLGENQCYLSADWVLRSEGNVWRYDILSGNDGNWHAVSSTMTLDILRDVFHMTLDKAMAHLQLAQAEYRVRVTS